MYLPVRWKKFREKARNRNIKKRLKIKRPRENSIQGRENSGSLSTRGEDYTLLEEAWG